MSKGALELTIFGFDAKFRMSYQLLYTYLLIERCIDNMVLNRKYDCFVTPEWAWTRNEMSTISKELLQKFSNQAKNVKFLVFNSHLKHSVSAPSHSFFRSFDDLSVRNFARWSPFVNWTISSQEGISVDNYSIIKVSKSSTSSPIKVRTVGPSMHRKKLSGIGSLMSSTA